MNATGELSPTSGVSIRLDRARIVVKHAWVLLYQFGKVSTSAVGTEIVCFVIDWTFPHSAFIPL